MAFKITTGEASTTIVFIIEIQQYLGSCGFRSGVDGIGVRNDQIGALRFGTSQLIGLFDQASPRGLLPGNEPSMIMPLPKGS